MTRIYLGTSPPRGAHPNWASVMKLGEFHMVPEVIKHAIVPHSRGGRMWPIPMHWLFVPNTVLQLVGESSTTTTTLRPIGKRLISQFKRPQNDTSL